MFFLLARIAEPLGVSELIVLGRFLIGSSLLLTDSSVKAEKYLSDAHALAAQADFPPPETPYDVDFIGMAHSTHAAAAMICSRPTQAIESLRLGRARADRIDHELTRANVSANAAVLGFLMDDPEFTRRAAEEGMAGAEGRGFHSMDLMLTILRGWARGCQGEVDEAVRDVEHGLELARKMGSVAGLPLLYVAGGEVFRMAKNRERATEPFDRATEMHERSGERMYGGAASLGRAQLELELGGGDPVVAEGFLLHAFEQTQSTHNLQWGLIVATRLARLAPQTGKVREAHERLERLYLGLSEGLERGHAREAKAALDALAESLA